MLKALTTAVLLATPFVCADGPQRVIKVMGEAEVTAAPDSGEIEFGVVVRDRTLDRADREFREKLAAVEKAVAALALPGDAARSSDTRILPLHGWGKNRAKELGYEVRKDFTVVVSDLSKMRRVLEALVGAGVNELDGVRFKSTREAELQAQALCAAAQNARTKAVAVAKAMGTGIGKVLTVRESSYYDDWGEEADAFGAAGGDDFGGFDEGEPAPPAVPEGRIRVSTTVFVTFELTDD